MLMLRIFPRYLVFVIRYFPAINYQASTINLVYGLASMRNGTLAAIFLGVTFLSFRASPADESKPASEHATRNTQHVSESSIQNPAFPPSTIYEVAYAHLDTQWRWA